MSTPATDEVLEQAGQPLSDRDLDEVSAGSTGGDDDSDGAGAESGGFPTWPS